MERQPYTSAQLTKQFPEAYRAFFSRCQRVASASNSFLWTGELAGFYGGLTISQKLPVRSYVGFETAPIGTLEISRQYQTYDPATGRFVTATTDDRLAKQLTDYLTVHRADTLKKTGLIVHFLTEVPLGHSLGANGAIAAALAILLHEDEKQIKQDPLLALPTAREILSLSQAGHSSGTSAYTALTAAEGPILFQSQPDSATYQTKLLSEDVAHPDRLIWPIDFGLIHTGNPTNAEAVIMANDAAIAELATDSKVLASLLDKKAGKKQIFDCKKIYIDMLSMVAGLTATSLNELFKKGSDTRVIERLFNSLNQFQNLLQMLGHSTPIFDQLYHQIHQLADKSVNRVGSGVKVSGLGNGGTVLFALPYGGHRQAILDLIERLKTQTGQGIVLDYASWLDGIGGQAGRIDQNLITEQINPLVGRDIYHLTIWRQGIAEPLLITHDHFQELAKSCDLLLDATTGKVSITGQPLTSKDLASQKATVSILSDLLATPTHSLENDKLPSSYGQNRYDLQGKIVLPLIKSVKQLTGRDLQLTIKGGMYEGYRLSIDPSNLVIGRLARRA